MVLGLDCLPVWDILLDYQSCSAQYHHLRSMLYRLAVAAPFRIMRLPSNSTGCQLAMHSSILLAKENNELHAANENKKQKGLDLKGRHLMKKAFQLQRLVS